MEKHLGKILDYWYVVHHKNGDWKDNRLDNLQVVTVSEHAKIHQGSLFGQ